jgi:hypothetical protein
VVATSPAYQTSWPARTVPGMKAPRRHCTGFELISSFQVRVLLCRISFAHARPVSATRSIIFTPAACYNVRDSDGGGQAIHVHPLHPTRPPIHGDDGGTGILHGHCLPSRSAGFNSQRSLSNVHHCILVGVFQAFRGSIAHVHRVPPSNWWPIRSYEDHHHVLKVFNGRSTTTMGAVAPLGRILLQFIIPELIVNFAVSSYLRA